MGISIGTFALRIGSDDLKNVTPIADVTQVTLRHIKQRTPLQQARLGIKAGRHDTSRVLRASIYRQGNFAS